jgi:hypothetical protein
MASVSLAPSLDANIHLVPCRFGLCCTENSVRVDYVSESLTSAAMITLFCLFLALFASPFKSKPGLEAENAALRY